MTSPSGPTSCLFPSTTNGCPSLPTKSSSSLVNLNGLPLESLTTSPLDVVTLPSDPTRYAWPSSPTTSLDPLGTYTCFPSRLIKNLPSDPITLPSAPTVYILPSPPL